jgi:hypothetical protein
MTKHTNESNTNVIPRDSRDLERVVLDLHSDAKFGRAAAEYNLVKAGAIEVASEHVPGHLRDDDVFLSTPNGSSLNWVEAPLQIH